MEAEKAAKVLEIAAMKSPVAQASLLESKMLIAEATQMIESIQMMMGAIHIFSHLSLMTVNPRPKIIQTIKRKQERLTEHIHSLSTERVFT